MKHCSNCVHCSPNMIALYVKGTEKFFCRVNHNEVERPFWGGFNCKNYKKDKGFCKNGASLEKRIS